MKLTMIPLHVSAGVLEDDRQAQRQYHAAGACMAV